MSLTTRLIGGRKAYSRRRAAILQTAIGNTPLVEPLEGRVLMAAQELLSNPSFSAGTSGWNPTGDFWVGTNLSNYRSAPGYAAGGVDATGQPKNYADGAIAQQFTVPSNATSVTASWYSYVTSNETTTSTAYDNLYVRLLDSNGNFLTNLASYSNLNKGGGYTQDSANLSGYAGRAVRLQFLAMTDSSLTTTFRIDDVSVVANVPDAQPAPGAPTSLTATAASSSQINLAWSDNSNNENGFSIERKTGSTGTWSPIATVGTNTTIYQSTGLSAGTTYYFRVRAYNSYGTSGYSNESSANTQSGTVGATDDYPSYLRNATQDSLTDPWGFYNRECTSYVAWRINRDHGSSGAPYFFTNTMAGPNGTTGTTAPLRFSDASHWKVHAQEIGLRVDHTPEVGAVAWFSYGHVAVVESINSNGTVNISEYNYYINSNPGTWSYRQNVIPDWFIHLNAAAPNNVAPTAPTNFRFTRTGAGQGALAWNDNSTNESSFLLQWWNGSIWSTWYTAGANTTSLGVGLASGYTYQMRVLAYNQFGTATSNVISVLA